MASTALKIRVGIFVLVGICSAVGAVIGFFTWLGTEDTTTCVSYFDESIAGLEPDAPVKYKGVKIGHVADINVGPDGKLIEVLMRIDSSFDMKKEFVSHVALTGITGLQYIEIEAIREGMKVELEELPFTPLKYKLIPSRLSELSRYGLAANQIFDRIGHLSSELGALLTELKTSQSVENLNKALTQFNNPKIGETIDHLESATKSINELMKEIDAEKMGTFLEEWTLLSRNLNALASELRDMTEMDDVIRATAETVKELNQTLKQSPSTILFSQPPQPRTISAD